MQPSATTAGPGIGLSPATHRRTVRASTPSWRAASSCDQPNAVRATLNCSGAMEDKAACVQGVTLGGIVGPNVRHRFFLAARTHQGARRRKRSKTVFAVCANGHETKRAGWKIGGYGLLLHNPHIGPAVLCVNCEMRFWHE